MTRYINSYTAILLLAILAGCKVSKDLTSPTVQVPEMFRNAYLESTSDTSNIGEISWKNFYTDLTLQNLIDSAVSNNYDMQIAIKNIDAAALLTKQVKWNYLPAVALNVGANSSRPSDNSLNGLSMSQFGIASRHIEDYTANVSLSWEADIWRKIRNQQKGIVAAYLQSLEAKKLIQTNLVTSVSQGYYNLLMLDAQIDIAKKNLSLNDRTLQIIKLQFEAGQVTSLAVQQAEAQRLIAAQLIPLFEKNITIQENALRILTSTLPDRITRKAQLEEMVLPKYLNTGLPSRLLSRRPDVKTAELALEIANSRVGISRAEMYPSIKISASGGINSFKASNWFNIPASLFGVVAGNLVQPILNRKILKTQYEVAKVDREKTVLQFRQSMLYAVGEVSDALVSIEKLHEEEALAESRVNALQEAIKNANLLFNNGMATYLEVLTAQSNVLQSELELASIKRDELSAVSELYRALGGGWN